MKSLAVYINVLEQIKERERLPFSFHTENHTLWIDDVPLTSARPSDVFHADFSGKGILSRRLSLKEKEFCRKQGISYLTTDGSLHLVRKQCQISVDPREPIPRKRNKSIAPTGMITPTQLISPNAFAILDVLFRLPESQINNFRSGLQFAKQFDLYQPKLSTMMTAMRVRTLPDLRRTISQLPIDWWMSALRYPAVRRVFSPFYGLAKTYHSLDHQPSDQHNEQYNRIIRSAGKHELAPGPTEVAKEFGLLRDLNCTVWGTPEALQKLKKDLRLIPGADRTLPTWFLATPPRGLEHEAIFSHLTPDHANVFRAIWDLSFGDTRLMEVQKEFLQRILK